MGRKIALVIGNSEYDDASLARLITPSEDVNDLATLLKSPDIGGFDEVSALVNESATPLRRSIARLFAQKTPDDLLLLYFSGHGVLDDQGQLYLAVKDTERELLSGTAIPASFITGEMDRSRSRRQVLMLDCCHSGAFARGSKGVVGASVGTASAFEGTGYGRVVLTATDATQYAWEGDQVIGQADNSVFTHFMIEGLQTGQADQDHDGRVTLDELYDYVYAQVVAKTPRQTPGKWSYKQQGDIVIAKNPHPPVVKAAELPGEMKQAIESPLAYVREGAVHELAQLLRSSNASLALAAREALQRLSEDDSRKVSLAAAESLNTNAAHADAAHVDAAHVDAAHVDAGQRQPEVQAENTARATAEQARVEGLAADAMAAQRAEQERRAKLETDAAPAAAAVVTPASIVTAVPVEAQGTTASITAEQALKNQQRTALLAGLIVSVGWFAGHVAGPIIGGMIGLALGLAAGLAAAGLITGFVLRRVIHSHWWPMVSLGIGWPICYFAGFYLREAGPILPVVATWLISSLTVVRVLRNHVWMIAVLTAATAAIAYFILESFGSDYYSPSIYSTAIAAIITVAAGGVLTFLLYRRADTTEPG